MFCFPKEECTYSPGLGSGIPQIISWSGGTCFTAETGREQMWFCETQISCLWSGMAVPFPRAEKCFVVIGVWESPRGEADPIEHPLKGELGVSTLDPGVGGSD